MAQGSPDVAFELLMSGGNLDMPAGEDDVYGDEVEDQGANPDMFAGFQLDPAVR